MIRKRNSNRKKSFNSYHLNFLKVRDILCFFANLSLGIPCVHNYCVFPLMTNKEPCGRLNEIFYFPIFLDIVNILSWPSDIPTTVPLDNSFSLSEWFEI